MIKVAIEVVGSLVFFFGYFWSGSLVWVDFDVCHAVFSTSWVDVLLAFYSFGKHVFETFLQLNLYPMLLEFLLYNFMYHSRITIIMIILRVVVGCYWLHHYVVFIWIFVFVGEIVGVLGL